MAKEGTEDPTPKRKREARRDGRVARSPEVAGWGVLLAMALVGPWIVHQAYTAVHTGMMQIQVVAQQPSTTTVTAAMKSALMAVFVAVASITAVGFVLALATTAAQVGLLATTKPLKPSLKRLNPVSNLKNILGVKGLWETGKQVIRATVILLLAWGAIRSLLYALVDRGGYELTSGLAFAAGEIFGFIRLVAFIGFMLGLGDYGFQRWQLRREMKMTRQEVVEEYKQSEGDPMLKSRIRSLQRERSRQRMMLDIPTATVVITNPTHYAVALRYRPDRENAPVVVALGADNVAAQIRAKATAAGVPIVESPPLARALHRSCSLGDPIPGKLFEAVARVLAFIARQRPTMGSTLSLEVDVPEGVEKAKRRRR